ncbi:MAG: hypothetical protein HGA30_05510, partial [Anaerolineales bacterium]|nr:hypothetical protein [Anaerolineales bacterium]
MLIFFLALFILLAGSLPWVAVSRPPNKPAWLLAYYLVCSANVVLTGYSVNSFRLLEQQWVMIAVHAVLGGLGWLIWGRRGKPSLWGPFQGWKPQFNVQCLKREPLLALLIFFTALSYAFALAQIIHIPQNNMDSLSTHLSRIVFWRQNGSFLPWSTTMLDQVWYPVNAQIQTYWTLLFLGSDQLVGIAQWLAALVSAMGVFSMARFFGYNPRRSAFAALIFLSFPLIALQSTTTQTDLVTTVFFIPAIYFLFLGLRDGQLSLLSLSAISVGLGVGVKKSYFLLLPILAVLALLALLQFGRRSLKPLLFWSFNLVIGIALFGAYIYVVNWRYFGNPFGNPTYIDTMIEVPQYPDDATGVAPAHDYAPHLAALTADPPPGTGILLELVYNTPRLLYQSLDTSGLPRPLDGYAHKVKMRVVRAFFQLIGFEEIEGTAYTASGHTFSFTDKNINEESHAWYGPLSFLLILPALVVATRQGLRQRILLLLGPGIALLVFLPLEIILRPGWDPFQGRYFAPLVALCAPLMASWFREKGTVVYEWLIGTLAVVILAVTLLYNPAKPTLGKFAEEFHIWNNDDRIFIQTIQRKKDREMYY